VNTKPLLNLGERVASTFLFTFMSVAAVGGSLNLKGLDWKGDALIAGGAAAQSLVKNVMAFLASQGNGPDVLTPLAVAEAPAPKAAPLAPVAPSGPAPTEAGSDSTSALSLGDDLPDDSDGSAVNG